MNKIAWLFIRLKHGLTRRISPMYYTMVARIKLGALGATIGPGLWVDGKIVLSIEKGDIRVGKNLRLRSRYRGNLVGMAYPVTFQLCKKSSSISIGDNCGFSAVIISSRSEVKNREQCDTGW